MLEDQDVFGLESILFETIHALHRQGHGQGANCLVLASKLWIISSVKTRG